MNERARAQAANRPQNDGTATEQFHGPKPEESMSKSEPNGKTGPEQPETNEQRLYAAPIGPTTYTILSRGNAGRNAYNVDIAELSCTCEDYQYNVSSDDDRNVCKHLEKALSIHPHPDAYYSFKGGQVAKVDVTQSAKDKETAEAVEETEAAITETPEDAHDRLLTSLDGTDIAFDTELDGSRIWFTFDEYVDDDDYLEFEDGPFAYYFLNPEMVEYEPDNAPEGFKNYVEAGDVDAYIEEVLA